MMSGLDTISNWTERAARAGFRISALASDCEVSERQLRRFIEETFGQPPHAWITGHRLKKATELLKTDLLLKQIADQLGFKTGEHFSREFKRFLGVSPRSYRRRLPRHLSDPRESH